MPNIHISNTSAHNQTFQVHGFNNNKDITVNAHSTATISDPSTKQASGAVLAVYDGHICEQAEITFNGWGNLEWLDISAIVGAAGNLTIEQVGNPKSRKGDPTFMQDLRRAYAKLDAHSKAAFQHCVHLDAHGQVIRIEAPTKDPNFEKFIRSFAEGKLYIGPGAWDGKKGDAGDNAQSSGVAGGNKDVLIVYSDANTAPGVHVQQAVSKAAHVESAGVVIGSKEVKPPQETPTHAVPETNGVHEVQTEATPTHPVTEPTPAAHPITSSFEAKFTSKAVAPPKSPFEGDHDTGGPGIQLSNKSARECTYFFFNNYWNGNGTAGANFDHPERSIALRPHTAAFIGLAKTFKGRVQRGKFIPATWVEFQLDAANGTGAWGDVSLEQGYDGAAIIRSLDGRNVSNGFDHDILPGAPAAATAIRAQDKVKVLASTMGNWLGGPNKAAIAYEEKVVGQKKAYITGGQGTDVVNSKNARLAIEFF